MNDLRQAYVEKLRLELRASKVHGCTVDVNRENEKIDKLWSELAVRNSRELFSNSDYAPRQR